jgi:hypothetical protein
MATTPPYAPPTVTAAGLVVSSYQSILQDNVNIFLNIYGKNQYTGYSSAVYQFLSGISLKHADANAGLQFVYNQLSPQTSVGTGLDRNLKFNGLARLEATFSICDSVQLTGTPGATISNGAVQDVSGNIWTLTSPLTFPTGGVLTGVTATCTTPGAITAAPGAINAVNAGTVTGGSWTGVTNTTTAAPGVPVETDSQAKARQALSVARPSLTRVQSVLAAILAVDGVTRVATGTPTSTLTPGAPGTSIENPTGTTDAWGNPAHSISMVAEGGADSAVAQAIYGARGIGCLTNGNTTVTVTDPTNQNYTMEISFNRPDYLQIYVVAQLKGYGGFAPTEATAAAVQSLVNAYLNELAIGETVSVDAVRAVAMQDNVSLVNPTYGFSSFYIGTATATPTLTLLVGNNEATASSVASLAVGQFLVDAQGLVPPGTTITGISGTTVTMSAAATASGSVPVVASAMSQTSDIPMPQYIDVAQTSAGQVQVLP